MLRLKSIPCIGVLLYSSAAIVIVICSFLRDGMIWWYAMVAISFPTCLVFRTTPLFSGLSRNINLGLFAAAIVVNGLVLYFFLLAIEKLVKSMRGPKPNPPDGEKPAR